MKGRWLAVLVIPLLASCSKDDSAAPRLYTLSGHVALVGFLVDDSGRFAGTRVVPDADGVRVELLWGTQVLATTTTTHGVFSFGGLQPGAYQVRSRVIGELGDKSLPLTIVQTDLIALDTLRLESEGDLRLVPNPMGQQVTAYYSLPDTQMVTIRIMNTTGELVRTLVHAPAPKGVNEVTWSGLGPNGEPATDAMYWMTLETAGSMRAQLLFR